MKKLVLILAVIFYLPQNSHALIFSEVQHGSIVPACGDPLKFMACAVTAFTSLPTLIVGFQEEMSVQDKEEFIFLEAKNLKEGTTSESVLLQKIADDAGVDVMVIATQILEGK
jgi:hypothetical protein